MTRIPLIPADGICRRCTSPGAAAQIRNQYGSTVQLWLCASCAPIVQAEHDQMRQARERVEAARVERDYNAEQVGYRCGISQRTFLAMHAAQDGKCGICLRAIPTRGRRVHVDHCHTTMIVRGLLCHRCNVWLGRQRDDAAMLRRAADWAERGILTQHHPDAVRAK